TLGTRSTLSTSPIERPRGSGPLDRQLLPVAPFLPRPRVVAHARITEQAQREVTVRGAVAALAVGDDFLVRRDARGLIDRAQVRGGLERAVGRQVALPLHVRRAGN